MRLDVLRQLLDNDRSKVRIRSRLATSLWATRRSRSPRQNATMVPDYYARLGVDPRAEKAEIEAALKRMQPAWSMGTRNPKTRHANQLYLDEIPALRKALLSDPASRAAYDADLAMVQGAEREQKLGILLRRVNLRAAKGGLTAKDRRLLSDEAIEAGIERGGPAATHAADP